MTPAAEFIDQIKRLADHPEFDDREAAGALGVICALAGALEMGKAADLCLFCDRFVNACLLQLDAIERRN